MPLPDSVPPIVETFKKRAELESQPSVEVDDVCGVFFYPRFDECEICEVGANNIAIWADSFKTEQELLPSLLAGTN